MRIDGHKVISKTARFSPAIGGNYAVRVDLARKNGEPVTRDGIVQEFVFGAFPETVARWLVAILKGPIDDSSSAALVKEAEQYAYRLWASFAFAA